MSSIPPDGSADPSARVPSRARAQRQWAELATGNVPHPIATMDAATAAQLPTAAPFLFLFSLRCTLRADAFCFLRTTLSGLTHFAFCREECVLSLVCWPNVACTGSEFWYGPLLHLNASSFCIQLPPRLLVLDFSSGAFGRFSSCA